jgi:hypothetical protein
MNIYLLPGSLQSLMTGDSTGYQPGVCNIGHQERKRRRLTGILGVGTGLAVAGGVVALGLPDQYALGAFAFLLPGALGFVQDRMRFCVAFGALARYDLTGSGGDAGSVTEREAVRADRKRALQILALSTALAAVATGLLYLAITLL